MNTNICYGKTAGTILDSDLHFTDYYRANNTNLILFHVNSLSALWKHYYNQIWILVVRKISK